MRPQVRLSVFTPDKFFLVQVVHSSYFETFLQAWHFILQWFSGKLRKQITNLFFTSDSSAIFVTASISVIKNLQMPKGTFLKYAMEYAGL